MNDLTIKAIEAYNGNLHNGMTKALEAVVAMVLEEAARVAAIQSVAPGYTTNEHMMAHRIAAAIRALKSGNDS